MNLILSNLVRTMQAKFRIGNVQVKDNSGVLEARDAADSAYINVKALGITLTNGAGTGKTLQSDSSGNASWVAGRDGLFRYKFLTSTANSDPGSGFFKVDNASLSLATTLRISDIDIDSNDISLWIAQWDDSTTTALRGILIFRKVGENTTFMIYNITGANSDQTTYNNLTVASAYVTGNFNDNDIFDVMFIRTGNTGSAGSNGSNGSNGTDGRSAGTKYTYLTDVANSDPGSGKLKFDNATFASIAIMRISETDGDSNALASWIATWDDSTSTIHGMFVMVKDSNPSVFAIFSVSGTNSDAGTYDNITVALVVSNGSFSNNDVVKVFFSRTGDKGDTGSTGSAGSNGSNGTNGVNLTANAIINGDFGIVERQYLTETTLTTYAADKYTADRWRVSVENASLQFQAQDAFAESGITARWFGRFKKITNAGKIVVYQPLEGVDSTPYRGRTMTFQVYMKTDSARAFKLTVVELQNAGTMDTIPATFISAYGASLTNPTLGTNLAYIGTPVSCSVTTSWTLFSVTVTVPSNSKNLIPMIFSDNQVAANGTLDVTQAMFVDGSATMAWLPRSFQQEFALCRRFFKRYGGNGVIEPVGPGSGNTTSTTRFIITYDVPMRTTSPTISASAASDWYASPRGVTQTGGAAGVSGPTITAQSDLVLTIQFTHAAASITAGTTYILIANNTTNARLTLESEL